MENAVEPDRPQTTTWRMRIACWIPKATNTQSEYVILIAILLQQQLQERASMLRLYLYVHCLRCYILHLYPVMLSYFNMTTSRPSIVSIGLINLLYSTEHKNLNFLFFFLLST